MSTLTRLFIVRGDASDLASDESLQDTLRKAREARAEKHWHPTTPARESLLTALQVLNKETSK